MQHLFSVSSGARPYRALAATILLGLLVGPLLESNFRRALIVSEHGPLIFLQSPISAGLLVLAGVLSPPLAFLLTGAAA